MAGHTATGYHRPVGNDPEEPTVDVGAGETEADRLTKPNHAGLLADSIEGAHPRCEFTASTSSTTVTLPGSTFPATLPLGHAGSIGDGPDGLPAYTTLGLFGGEYHSVHMTAGGLYEFDGRVTIAAGTAQVIKITLQVDDESAGDLRSPNEAGELVVPFHLVARVAADGKFYVDAAATTADRDATLTHLSIRRVGP